MLPPYATNAIAAHFSPEGAAPRQPRGETLGMRDRAPRFPTPDSVSPPHFSPEGAAPRQPRGETLGMRDRAPRFPTPDSVSPPHFSPEGAALRQPRVKPWECGNGRGGDAARAGFFHRCPRPSPMPIRQCPSANPQSPGFHPGLTSRHRFAVEESSRAPRPIRQSPHVDLPRDGGGNQCGPTLLEEGDGALGFGGEPMKLL